MRQFAALRAITRRELRINYLSPQVCQLDVVFSGSGSSASESATIDIHPVYRKTGPSSVSAVFVEGSDSVEISWSELDYAYSYVIYRATDPSGPWAQVAANVFHSPYTDDSPIPPDTYYYKVTGIEPNHGETLSSPVSDALLIM